MALQDSITEYANWIVVKAKEFFAASIGKPAAEQAPHLLTGAASATTGVGGAILVGGFGAVSAVVNQIEYNAQKKNIAVFYDEELSAKLHKSVKKVDASDLESLEKGDTKKHIEENGTIKGAIRKERLIRNVGIAASFIASVATYALMGAVVGHPALAFDLPTVARVAVSVLTYMALKVPVVEFAKSMLGLNKETTHDKIVEIAKDRRQGKSITREQVVEVFVSGNKDLSQYVEDHFGKKYEALALADKVNVAENLAKILPIDTITANINSGVTSASELAFTVEGQMSGVLPKAPEKREHRSMLESFKHKCQHIAAKVGQIFTPKQEEQAMPIPHLMEPLEKREMWLDTNSHGNLHLSEQPAQSQPSHVERVGRGKSEQQGSHAERILAARANTMPASQTIH